MGQAKQKRQQGGDLGMVPATRRPPRRISADDAAYLRKVRVGVEEAGRLEQRAAQLEQEAVGLRQQAIARVGAYDVVVAHLCEKYGLDKDADKIDHDTLEIVRAPMLEIVPDRTPAPATTSLRASRPPQDEAGPGGEGDERAPNPTA